MNPSTLNSSDLQSIQEDYQQAEYSRLKMAANSLRFWMIIGACLGVVFLVINSMQAYWALAKLAGMATDSGFNAVVTGLIAIGLIMSANVISIRLGTVGQGSRSIGLLLLTGLMLFSIVTSSLHLAWQVQGGHEASIQQSDGYQRAVADYDRAAEAYDAVIESAKDADTVGDYSSGGWIRKKYVPGAKSELDAARSRLESVTEGGTSATATVLHEVAAWFGLSPEKFSTRFALVAVILMEAARIWLSLEAGSAIRRALGSQTHPEAQGAREKVA